MRKRLAERKNEMADLRDEDLKYRKSPNRYHPAIALQHEQRVIRMKQIVEEIAKLMPPKR